MSWSRTQQSEVLGPRLSLPVLSCSVNTPVGSVVEGGVQAADWEQLWVEENWPCGKQPGNVSWQQRKGVA